MRKLTKLALGTITGIIAGATTVKLSRDIAESSSGKYVDELPPGFVWLDGMDLDKSDEDPLFDEGETVYLVNPHLGGFWAGNSAMSAPVVFEVIDAEYDEEDIEWRYKIYPRDVSESECGLPCDLETEWFAEKWLDIADKPSMRRTEESLRRKDFVRKAEEDSVKEGEINWRKPLREMEIDYWLDTMRYSTDEKERKQAEDRLKELTGGDAE